MSFELPPIVKLARRISVEIETAVRQFARFHKYTTGTRLRDKAFDVAVLSERVWRDKPRQAHWVSELVYAVDDFKLALQIAKDLHAFRSFAQFEALARLVSDLGRQCGGLKKHQQGSGQNAGSQSTSVQRPQRLSACGASGEATP